MAAITVPQPLPVAAPPAGIARAVRDARTMTWRNLLGYLRIPQALFFASVQPIMFVLLFRYAFGGAVPIPGVDYEDFLLPGIFVQAVSFGAMSTAIGLADDKTKGLFERFRSLPMARSAVLAGRTSADMCRNVFVLLLMVAVGYLVGFDVKTNFLAFLAGLGIVLFWGYTLSWGASIIGLGAETPETAQLKIFPILLPLTFASSAFVPTDTMPDWLQTFANNQPFTQVVNAVRALMLGGPTAHSVVMALAWCTGLLILLAPIAVHRYRRTL